MKRCPVCSSMAFDDMDICYGCMTPFADGGFDGGVGEGGAPRAMLGRREPLRGVTGVERFGEVSAYTVDSAMGDDGIDGLLDALIGGQGDASIEWVVNISQGPGRKWARRFPAGTRSISIGRASDNDIKVRDMHVSRHHAELVFTAGGIWLKDLDSRNMTYADGVPVFGSRRISAEVPFRIGGAELMVARAASGGVDGGA